MYVLFTGGYYKNRVLFFFFFGPLFRPQDNKSPKSLFFLFALLVFPVVLVLLAKAPNPWLPPMGVDGLLLLLAHAPEFHELAAKAFMEGAASLVLVLPKPSSEIRPEALAQISLGLLEVVAF